MSHRTSILYRSLVEVWSSDVNSRYIVVEMLVRIRERA